MFWADKLAEQIDPQVPQIINDSKTPSGRAHVGALRGVIIHDVMLRVLRENGIDARYTFGVDDYDPLDELPYGKDEQFRPFLGKPLCEVPPPPGTTASDMADYYISDFFSVFAYLGVKADTYRLRDIYRSGQFDESIDIILARANKVRELYHKVSGSVRPPNWLPFQMICENCGRIGTTEAYAYDGKEVSYRCRPDLVKWAKGCGHVGKNTPFSGRGKLPWKLEWVAKWATMGITIEGAGKDHNTKGGSRDVAKACLSALFNKKSPLNIPYEFFLVSGAKMSSSMGIGVTSREMADFLPPEVLRFLILRTQPNRPLNFAPDEKSVTKLFNEFDRCREIASITSPSVVKVIDALADPMTAQGTKSVPNGDAEREQLRIYRLSEVISDEEYEVPNIQLVQALVQLPHLDVVAEVGKRRSHPLTPVDSQRLQQRIASVRYWLQNYADESERIELQLTIPSQAADLTQEQQGFLRGLAALTLEQKDFLRHLAGALKIADWDGESLQTLVFSTAKLTGVPQPEAFNAIYMCLFGKPRGPRAGPLFSYLERDFLVQRFQAASMLDTIA